MKLILKSTDGLSSHLLAIDEFILPRYADRIRLLSSDRKNKVIIEYVVKDIIHDYIDNNIILYGDHV